MGRGILEECRDRLRELAARHNLDRAEVTVTAQPLTPEEAIGRPTRRDYPILEGKERVIEAAVLGARGQAFTDAPSNFSGQLRDVLALPLDNTRNRAVFLATMNAVMRSLGEIGGVLHCKDEEPERCAAGMARAARAKGARSVGLIGFNPAIAEALADEFGPGAVCITDLNPRNAGQCRFGVTIWDGRRETGRLIAACDLILVTGTALVNGTFDAIEESARAHNKPLVVFGITAAAVCRFMALERWCAQARDESTN